jgi:hypothetical protein
MPSSAFAWGNGPSGGAGFGTHDWIVSAANRFAIGQNASWLDEAEALRASSEPDYINSRQANHNYDRWGHKYGHADQMVSALYSQAVVQFRQGDRTGASRTVGLLSHYFADACDPLHTDDKSGESKVHGKFERAVDKTLKSRGAVSYWARYDGYQHVTHADALTVSAAKHAHGSYSKLLKNYAKKGYNKTSVGYARDAVGHAANGLADIIVSIQQDAVEVSSSPIVRAHQGVAAGEQFNYLFHTNQIQRFDKSWVATGTNDDPLAGLPGFTQPHLGDGCYHDGKLYLIAENWPDVTNQYLLIFDAVTLERLEAKPTGREDEVASICIGPREGGGDALWIASFLDSSRLFRYDLDTLEYSGDMTITPEIDYGIQGLTFGDGRFYVATSPNSGAGKLYSVSTTGTARQVYTHIEPGFHEGLEYEDGKVLWLIDHSLARVRYLQFPSFLLDPAE